MSNMSYCRFRNTAGDIADCADALESLLCGGGDEPLSYEEKAAAKRLILRCQDIVLLVKETAGVNVEDELTDRDIDALLNEN